MHQAFLQSGRLNETDFSRVRYCGYGAAPMPIPLREKLRQVIGCRFYQLYGMTESAYVTSLDPSDHEGETAKSNSVGRALPGVKLKIVDADGNEVPAGQFGEVAVQSPLMMERYWNLPEDSARAFQDGWYLTGDGGHLDEDGYLFLGDRIKDMIVSGGENIFAAEIENVLYRHPSVESAAVVGVADEKWGEVPKAFIVVRSGEEFAPAELHAFAAQHLARFKLPKFYAQIDVLPLNASGKVLKRELRKQSNIVAVRP